MKQEADSYFICLLSRYDTYSLAADLPSLMIQMIIVFINQL